MSDLSAIRSALATKIKNYIKTAQPGIEVKPYAGLIGGVKVELVPGDPYTVYFDPSPDSATTMGGSGFYDIYLVAEILIPAAAGAPESAQMLADDLLSVGTANQGSVVDAVMAADKTLGGLISDLIIRRTSCVYVEQGVMCRIPIQIAAQKTGAKV